MPLPEARLGDRLKIAGQEIAFSFWPVGRTTDVTEYNTEFLLLTRGLL